MLNDKGLEKKLSHRQRPGKPTDSTSTQTHYTLITQNEIILFTSMRKSSVSHQPFPLPTLQIPLNQVIQLGFVFPLDFLYLSVHSERRFIEKKQRFHIANLLLSDCSQLCFLCFLFFPVPFKCLFLASGYYVEGKKNLKHGGGETSDK